MNDKRNEKMQHKMEDKKAIEVLSAMIQKPTVTDEEKEAVRLAIGILAWSTLGESRLKKLKSQREKLEEKKNRMNDIGE